MRFTVYFFCLSGPIPARGVVLGDDHGLGRPADPPHDAEALPAREAKPSGAPRAHLGEVRRALFDGGLDPRQRDGAGLVHDPAARGADDALALHDHDPGGLLPERQLAG